jgi:hypothetical protein
MGYRITAVHIHDFKRIESVEITPPADASLILLAGNNGAGKTSVLDALTAALRGPKALPAEPIRRGAKAAEIVVEFDGGALSIQRVINSKGAHLEIRNTDGVVKASPQTMLDKLIGSRTLDPLDFLQKKPPEQLAQLMKLIPDAARIEELNAKRESQFNRRREIGAKQKDAAGELERLREVKLVEGETIDVAALAAESAKLQAVQHEGNKLMLEATSAKGAVEIAESNVRRKSEQLAGIHAHIERLRKEAAELDAVIETESADLEAKRTVAAKSWQKAVDAKDAWVALQPRRDEIDEQLAKADAHNRALYESRAHAKRLQEAEAAAKTLDEHYADCTSNIEKIDERKKQILSAAKLPVPELAVTEDEVLFGGVPFAQASGAERLRVSVALAIAGSPNLDDIWVRDAAIVDDAGVKLIADLAQAAGKRVWLEVIRSTDPGAVIIHDGKVASEVAA